MYKAKILILIAGSLVLAGATHATAQEKENAPSITQVVALDECDPTTFNAAVGPDFCKNVTLGRSPPSPIYSQEQKVEPPARAGTLSRIRW
jgi:hypothetical protein